MLCRLLLLLFIETFEQRFKLKPLNHGKGFLIKQLRKPCLLKRIIKLTVRLDRRKRFAQHCLITSLFQKVMRPLRRYLIQMCVSILNRRIRGKDLDRRLFSDTCYTRNII